MPESPNSKPLHFLAPRYWATWLMLGILRLLALLPYRWQMSLGSALGRLLYHLMGQRRHIARVNIDLCFPELNTEQRNKLVKSHFRSSGMTLFEAGLSWWAKPEQLNQLCHINGGEHLEAAHAKGKGVILLSAHFTCFELAGRMLAMHYPFYAIYKKQHRNPLYEAVTNKIRSHHYQGTITHHDVRGIIRCLKKGEICWYLPDQDFGRANSVFAPFMGVSTATVTGTTRIARLTGAAVVPYFPLRRQDGQGYELTILPALEDFPSCDEVKDASHYNQLIETQIHKAPEQYLWLHRRFKTRPEGEADVYK